MQPSSICLLLCLSINLVLTVDAADDDGGNTTNIKEACKAAGDAASYCEQALMIYPESRRADARQLAALSIRYAADSAVEAARWSAGASDRVGNEDTKLQACLTDCSEHMMNAVEMLDESTAAIDEEKYGDVATFLSAAMSDATSCNEGCEGTGARVEKEDMKKKSDDVFNLCGISMALTHRLH